MMVQTCAHLTNFLFAVDKGKLQTRQDALERLTKEPKQPKVGVSLGEVATATIEAMIKLSFARCAQRAIIVDTFSFLHLI